MRYISTNSDGSFLKYDNPGTNFWAKYEIFLQISSNWPNTWPKMIFLSQYSNCFYENPDIEKSGGIKIQIFLLAKID